MSKKPNQRQLPARPDSEIYECIPSDRESYDSFDESEPENEREEYLNASDLKKQPSNIEERTLPSPWSAPRDESENRASTVPPKFTPAKPPALPISSRRTPQPPSHQQTRPPPHNTFSTSSTDSYDYVEEMCDSEDENYEIPDNDRPPAVRKNSVPQIPMSQRPVPPLPGSDSSQFKNKISANVAPKDEVELMYEVENPRPTTRKIAALASNLENNVRVTNAPNHAAKYLATPQTNEINRSTSHRLPPNPPDHRKFEKSDSDIPNRTSARNTNSPNSEPNSCGWYFPKITRDQASIDVKSLKQDGSFLVRRSQKGGPDYPYSITILCQNHIYNLNIRKRPDGFYALGKEKQREQVFGSVAELISFYTNNPMDLINPRSKNVDCSVRLKAWPK